MDRLAKSLEKTNLDDNAVLFVQNQLDRLNQELEWLRKKVNQMDQNNQKMDCLQQRVIALEVENAKNKHFFQDTSKLSLSFGLSKEFRRLLSLKSPLLLIRDGSACLSKH